MIIVDTREKDRAIRKILDYFDEQGLKHWSHGMIFGDYMDYAKPLLVIDRKQNILELAKNCTSEHERFKREMERAKEVGAHLVILVEQDKYKDRGEWVRVKTIEDLMRWSTDHKTKTGRTVTMRGEQVYRILASWKAKYPISVEFCDKRSTGRRITEILCGTKTEPHRSI